MKLKFVIAASLLMLIQAAAARAQEDIVSTADTLQQLIPAADSIPVKASILADQIIEEARTHIGAPYVYGGKGPRVFDCSGFTRYVYSKFGYTLSPTAAVQVGEGRRVSGHIANLQKGDLVFFSGRGGGKRVGHVGIFIEMDDSGEGFRFIHAAVHGGIKISNVKEGYYASRFLGASRVIPDFASHLTIQDDTTAVISILDDGKDYVVDFRDTLDLGENGRRIVLLSDGSWAYVSPDGNVSKPDSTLRIVLTPDGRWTAADITLKQLPEIDGQIANTASATRTNQPADRTSSTRNPAPKKSTATHTVKSGETLYSIARKNGTTVDKIKKLNGLKSDNIQPGKKLRVK